MVYSGRVSVIIQGYGPIFTIDWFEKWTPFFHRLAEEAAQACLEQRDLHGLQMIHTSAKNNNDRALLAKVENYMAKVFDKR